MKVVLATIGAVIVSYIGRFISSAFLYFGYSILVKHFGLPYFSYWEIFLIYMAIASLSTALWRSPVSKKGDIKND